MNVRSLETSRKLIDAALTSGVFSDVEVRAVQMILETTEPKSQEVEAAFHTLAQSLDSLMSDSAARRQAIDLFLERLKQLRFVQMGSSKPLPETSPGGSVPRSAPVHPGTAIQWAGSLGRVVGRENHYNRGVPEPTYFAKSAVEQEAMSLCAEVYAPGLTDNGESDYAGLYAEVETTLDPTGQPSIIRLEPKVHARRCGNNVRLQWDLREAVAVARPGRYTYQFRFSVDGRQWVYYPSEPRHFVVTNSEAEIPDMALVESSLLSKVGEITPSRIGWIGTPMIRTEASSSAQVLPAEVTLREHWVVQERSYLELAVQVWAPGVSNRADLTAEEHSLALRQLGVRIESPFFSRGSQPLRFAGKAGIHEHDDMARFNLNNYFAELRATGGTPPPSGDYVIEIVAGEKRIGSVLVHWVRDNDIQ